jgi:hypothetical protein
MDMARTITANFRGITSLLFTGQQMVVTPSPLVLSATLSGPAGMLGGLTITFASDIDPTTGVAGPYMLGTATTSSSGQAVLSVDTTGWLEAIYTITVTFAGTATLEPSSDNALITVALPGSAATGGGWYTLNGSGRINFGFTVNQVPNSDPVQYKGQFLLHNNGKWRLKGSLNNYGYDAATRTGSASGIGKLYVWDAIGMQWNMVDDDVVFCIQFVDNNQGGGTGKNVKVTTPDMFGINIAYTPSDTQPDIPNSVPQLLKGGDISMKDLSAPTTPTGGTTGGGKKK